MRQKFLIGYQVKIEVSHVHFPCKNPHAIVKHTYSQAYGGTDVYNYSLVILDKKDGKAINIISWFKDADLTLIDTDIIKGMQIMEDYEFNKLIISTSNKCKEHE